MTSGFVDVTSSSNSYEVSLVFLIKFGYWSTFDVNIMTCSLVMTIFVYKGLTRNPEIGNTPV